MSYELCAMGYRLYGFTALRLYGFTALRLYGETIGLGVVVVKPMVPSRRIAIEPRGAWVARIVV